MTTISEIPIFQYIQANNSLPVINFRDLTRKHKSKYPFLYKILSTQFCNNLLSAKNYFIESSSFLFIQDHLNSYNSDFEEFYNFKSTTLFTLTTPSIKNDTLITHIIIVTPINNTLVLDILSFANTELLTWLSGLLYDMNQIHITVSYNLNESQSIQILNYFHFILRLITLKTFDKLTASKNINLAKFEKRKIYDNSLIHIDVSNVREYLIPSTNRREHYRWQICGPGRTILKHIKVQSSIVKNHIRKGKRLT